jgi:hypothetical protein
MSRILINLIDLGIGIHQVQHLNITRNLELHFYTLCFKTILTLNAVNIIQNISIKYYLLYQ